MKNKEITLISTEHLAISVREKNQFLVRLLLKLIVAYFYNKNETAESTIFLKFITLLTPCVCK